MTPENVKSLSDWMAEAMNVLVKGQNNVRRILDTDPELSLKVRGIIERYIVELEDCSTLAEAEGPESTYSKVRYIRFHANNPDFPAPTPDHGAEGH